MLQGSILQYFRSAFSTHLSKRPLLCISLSGHFRQVLLHCPTIGNKQFAKITLFTLDTSTGPRSADGNVSGYRCVSDCRSRGREFDPGLVPYFRGD